MSVSLYRSVHLQTFVVVHSPDPSSSFFLQKPSMNLRQGYELYTTNPGEYRLLEKARGCGGPSLGINIMLNKEFGGNQPMHPKKSWKIWVVSCKALIWNVVNLINCSLLAHLRKLSTNHLLNSAKTKVFSREFSKGNSHWRHGSAELTTTRKVVGRLGTLSNDFHPNKSCTPKNLCPKNEG